MSEATKTVSVGNRKYILGSTLGVGGFSEVKKGVDVDTRKRVALKIMYTQDQDAADRKSQLMQVQKEIKAMKQLNHPNIIRLLGYDLKCSVGNKRAIVMVQQLAPKGELFDYLMYTKNFKQNQAIALFHQLIAGLKAMHDAGIAHRDLKPENLLFDNQFNLKIADFGFSYHYQKGEGPKTAMRTELGTKGYMAPEIISNKKYTEKADIFAAGVILFIMLAGFPPFQNAVATDWWFDKLQKKKYKLFWMAHERTAKFSPESKEILQWMLAPTEAQRCDINEVQKTTFFNAPHMTVKELQQELKKRKQAVDTQKQQEKLDGNSRDTLMEIFNSLPEEQQANLPAGRPLLLKSLLHNNFKDNLEKVQNKNDFFDAVNSLAKQENANIDQKGAQDVLVELSKSLSTDEQFTEFAKFLLSNPKNLHDHEAIGNNEALAEFLGSQVKMTKLGKVDDWDVVNKFSALDSLNLPAYNLCQLKNHSYNVKCGFGLLAYCVSRFAHQRGKTLVDPENRWIDLHMKIKKSMTLPSEDENEKVSWYKCTMPIKLKIRITLRNALGDDPSWGYILSFQNISESAMSMVEYDHVVNELTTNNNWFLALLINNQFNPSCVNPEEEKAKFNKMEDMYTRLYDITEEDTVGLDMEGAAEEEVISA